MISIIIPTFNRKNMLIEAIESIKQQSYNNYEIIVVDDVSTDDTSEYIKQHIDDYKIKYFRNEENKGPGYNRNFGFKQSKGEYIIFMDDDDYYTDKNFFDNAINILEKEDNSDLAFVSANAYVEYEKTSKVVPSDIGCEGVVNGLEFLLNLNKKYNKPKSTFTTIFKRNILLQANILDMKMVNDYAIFLRALLFGDAYILTNKIGRYRVHDNNISTNIQCNFLIENLEERRWVKERLQEKLDVVEVNNWWKGQMITLQKYYLFGTKPQFADAWRVTKWIVRNSVFSLDLFVKVFLYQLVYWI